MAILEEAKAHRCPCCGHQVEKLDVQMLIDVCGVSDYQAAILRAVWRGKGYPVPTERIFDAMYADDPNGGPSRSAMYNSFKIALCRLRKRIRDSGVWIVNVGYARGYAIRITASPLVERLKALQEAAAPRRRKPLPACLTPNTAQLAFAL